MLNASNMHTKPSLLEKPWWNIQDVADYLTLLRGRTCTRNAAKIWMNRNNVRRSKADRRLTCRTFVDAALNKR